MKNLVDKSRIFNLTLNIVKGISPEGVTREEKYDRYSYLIYCPQNDHITNIRIDNRFVQNELSSRFHKFYDLNVVIKNPNCEIQFKEEDNTGEEIVTKIYNVLEEKFNQRQ